MIKLVLSILIPVTFLANFWVCEYLYPHPENGWEIFIPMDKLSHNFWSVIILGYASVSTMRTKYPITDFFLFWGVMCSFFDVSARIFGMSDFDHSRYLFALVAAPILAGFIYGYKQRQK